MHVGLGLIRGEAHLAEEHIGPARALNNRVAQVGVTRIEQDDAARASSRPRRSRRRRAVTQGAVEPARVTIDLPPTTKEAGADAGPSAVGAILDIAGTAWKSGSEKGATGRPVPLLLNYLRNVK